MAPDAKTVSVVRSIIAEHYSAAELDTLRPLHDNCFYVARGSQPYMLKLHNALCAPNIAQLSLLYRAAGESGLAPEIVPTISGDLLVKQDGIVFSLQEYLEPDTVEPHARRSLPEMVAELHRVLGNAGVPAMTNHLQRTVGDMQAAAKAYGYEKLLPVIALVQEYAATAPEQTIHGDLHPGNVLVHNGRLVFIDMDSSSTFCAASDATFAAFRFCNADPARMRRFVGKYSVSASSLVPEPLIWPLVVFNVLERILFICIERDRGFTCWMSDLENQKRYLDTAVRHLEPNNHKETCL